MRPLLENPPAPANRKRNLWSCPRNRYEPLLLPPIRARAGTAPLRRAASSAGRSIARSLVVAWRRGGSGGRPAACASAARAAAPRAAPRAARCVRRARAARRRRRRARGRAAR
eukprot:6178832-Pleurochrysis_carterae.AAC.2